MKRSTIPIAVAALAGLLAGIALFMGADDRPSTASLQPARTVPRATAATADHAPSDTGGPAAPDDAPDRPAHAAQADIDDSLTIADLGPLGTVHCELDGDLPPQLDLYAIPDIDTVSAAIEEGLDHAAVRGVLGTALDWRRSGSGLVFELPVNSPMLSYQVQAGGSRWRDAVAVDWDGDQGRCRAAMQVQPPVSLTVSGRVEGMLDDDRIWVDICGRRSFLYPGSPSFKVQVELRDSDPCLVHAARADGAIYARSDMVEIDPADGDASGIVLHMPDIDVGGIGVPVRAHPDGMQIGVPTPGTPAAEAGLESGDVILAVDGQVVAGWDLYEIIGLVTGEVGTSVELQVRTAAGEEETIDFERAWVEDKAG